MTFDHLAIILAIAAVTMRVLDRPYWSNLLATLTIAASTVGGWSAHRRQCQAEADLAEARRSGRPAS